jgi:cellulose synthase/poly-beta-1,6-N-acetylglucosamine synthase-like glycosyltransferase
LVSPLPHHLGQSFALGHVGEYARVVRALAPLASTLAFLIALIEKKNNAFSCANVLLMLSSKARSFFIAINLWPNIYKFLFSFFFVVGGCLFSDYSQ